MPICLIISTFTVLKLDHVSYIIMSGINDPLLMIVHILYY